MSFLRAWVALLLIAISVTGCHSDQDISTWLQNPDEFSTVLHQCELKQGPAGVNCQRVLVMAQVMQAVQHLSAQGELAFSEAQEHLKDLDAMHQAGQLSEEAWQTEDTALNQKMQAAYETWQLTFQEHLGQWIMAAQSEIVQVRAQKTLDPVALSTAEEKVQILYAVLRQLDPLP